MQPLTRGKGVKGGGITDKIICDSRLLHGWQCPWAIQSEYCVLISYPSEHNGPICLLRIARFDPAQENNYLNSETSIERSAKGLGKLVPYI